MKRTIIECDVCGDVILRDFWTRLQKGAVAIRTKELQWVLDAAHYDLYTKRPTWSHRKYHICPKCVERIEEITDTLAYINKLESTYGQVSKALCGKENATLDKVLKAVDQLKSRLAQAERERDAAIHDIWGDCCYCDHNSLTDPRCIERCKRCKHAADAEDRDELGVDLWE